MDAVAAPDRDGVLVLQRALLQRRQKCVQIGQQNVRRPHQLHVEAGVQHVRGRHPLMDEPRVVAHVLGQVRQEGDHVVLGLALDLVDAVDIELNALSLPHRLGRRFRDHAKLRLRVAGMRLDLEPDAELGLGRPDGDHLGAGIAGDHGASSRLSAGCRRGSRAE